MHTLYATLGSGNCFKPFLAMRQLSVPFRTIAVDVLSGQTRQDAFLKINAAGSVPYLLTPEGVGVGESNAMLWLLADGSHLMPASALERAQSLQWMFFEQSKLEPFISPARFFSAIVPERGVGREDEIAVWRERAKAGLAVLDAHLASNEFMVGGRYGITDIALYGYVHVAGEAAIDMKAFPSVERWMRAVSTTPGYVPIGQLCADAIPFIDKGTA